ncbi:hypothetical protein SELMODRAFT_181161 [Selaginella moellendorffii]|uniref:MHD domain-containing protein n=1 Tax=Selaginella moellendorffii TaxID=88036 RepID=D8SMW9_SELML|nr:AP-3 complex subunit mu [Selaginella moellendorffii]EFJ14351.1 hypothetical protein SELMODRAFT_181161 [Selaginella moellendorffii]|eukprot:XP_002984706.1 AP-3 complex subunit mu [Selaginella moellendorffii]
MIQCLFLLSDAGDVILEKQWMGKRVERSICSWFWRQRSEMEDQDPPSVIASPTHYLLHIVREGVTFLACTASEMPPLLGIEFLCKVASVLENYLGGLNEDILKDNFVIVYEILDEMMDSGFPSTTEPSVLKEIIAPPNLVSRVLSVVTGTSSSLNAASPLATSSQVSWRASNVKHSNNEIYFDLVEEMDAVFNRDGFVVKCEAYGEIQATSRLSGMPELSLTFANADILHDVNFHPCVRYRAWEADQMLSFIPPDGAFKLMSYRVKGLKNPPLFVRPQLSSGEGICRVNVLVGLRGDPGKPVDAIIVQLPWPPSVVSTNLSPSVGTVTYSFSTKVSTWIIGRIPKDKSPCLSGTLQLEPGINRLEEFPTFLVGFKIQGTAVSGLKVDKMDIRNVEYRPYKGFRAVTRAASYEIRT